jgi:hypothetical protein
MPRTPQMRGKFRISTDVLYEEPFAINSYRQSPRLKKIFSAVDPTSVYKMTRGRVSTITGEMVRLEVCLNAGGVLSTSVPAYQRFVMRLNGVIPNDDPEAQTDRYFRAVNKKRPNLEEEWTGSERNKKSRSPEEVPQKK